MNAQSAIKDLLKVMARLRAPDGCPWDREQDHRSLRFHAVEEVYELMDAIEAEDDHEMAEELGDLLLQVVFHCQLAQERGSFDFAQVTGRLVEKLVRRHPHVFGAARVKSVDGVWAQWERIKQAEKRGTKHARGSALDGIPKHLPALLRAEKLIKRARKAGLRGEVEADGPVAIQGLAKKVEISQKLFALVEYSQQRGWSAEALLRAEIQKKERAWRRTERGRTREHGAK